MLVIDYLVIDFNDWTLMNIELLTLHQTTGAT